MQSDKIVLIGGGGHCKSVLDTLYRIDEYSEIVITDYNLPIGTKVLNSKVVGDDEIFSELYSQGFTNASLQRIVDWGCAA